MTAPAFTRAPWHVTDGPGVAAASGDIAEFILAPDCCNEDAAELEAHANARLIACAPELYDALEHACLILETLGRNTDKGRALLARARRPEAP